MMKRIALSGILCVLTAPGAIAGCGVGSPPPATAPVGGDFRERPGQQATSLHLSAADCRALASATRKRVGRPLRKETDPTLPNSRCQLSGRGVHVSISLDTAHEARQRYENRMTEQVQFNAPYPSRDPRHVAGVGDRAAGEHFASWIPAYSTLYAVRGNRWITLAYSIAGESRRQRLAGAADLALQAFRLSAR